MNYDTLYDTIIADIRKRDRHIILPQSRTSMQLDVSIDGLPVLVGSACRMRARCDSAADVRKLLEKQMRRWELKYPTYRLHITPCPEGYVQGGKLIIEEHAGSCGAQQGFYINSDLQNLLGEPQTFTENSQLHIIQRATLTLNRYRCL